VKGKNPKCKLCGKELNRDEAYVYYKGKTKQYCCSEEEYQQFIDEKEMEKYYWNKLYEFVKKNVLDYDSVKQLPRSLIIRLQNLRNGTSMQPTVGVVKQSKCGYSYKVILKTFEKHLQDIKTWTQMKSFNSENQRINYIMAIIENNINKVYDNEKKEHERILSLFQNNEDDIDIKNMNLEEPIITKQTQKKICLSDLLDEQDLD
jgi:hypothetical protein